MDIKHRPLFKTDQAVEEISKQDGVPVKYVATTELKHSGHPVDVFYRDTPHPEFGNRYFALYFSYVFDSIMICNADLIEDLTFAMIQDRDRTWHYSQHNHDFVDIEGNFVDGGRGMVRSSGEVTLFKVVDGEFEKVDAEEQS